MAQNRKRCGHVQVTWRWLKIRALFASYFEPFQSFRAKKSEPSQGPPLNTLVISHDIILQFPAKEKPERKHKFENIA